MLLALVTFCLVATITPGPNNMMLLSSGASFGLRRTVPHILGISAGCAVMVLIVGWSVGSVAQQLPAFYTALQIVSAAYLLWLAWRIATSDAPGQSGSRARPMNALEAAAFQWVNPKAWAMVLGAVTSFARPDRMMLDVPLIALVLILTGVPCITLWAGSGSALKRFLSEPAALRTFNYGMAALLVVSILPGLWDVFGRNLPQDTLAKPSAEAKSWPGFA
jgi:threonine/homoserine/homoserine lactone efflux protein